MPLPEHVRELRSHATWDAIKEGASLMLPFLAGFGIKEWVHVHEAALMFTTAFLVAAGITFWDLFHPKGKTSLEPPVLESIAGVDFRDRDILVDGKQFTDCTFTNVVFKWDGAPFMFMRGTINGTRRIEISHPGPAGVIDFLKMLGFLSDEFAQSWRRTT